MLLTKPFFPLLNRVLLSKSHYGWPPEVMFFACSRVLRFLLPFSPPVFICYIFFWRTVEERLGYLGLSLQRIQIDNREPAVQTVGVENRVGGGQRIYQTEVVGVERGGGQINHLVVSWEKQGLAAFWSRYFFS